MLKISLQINLSVVIVSFLVRSLSSVCSFFLFQKHDRVSYYKILTNLTCSSRTEEYWPLNVVLYGPHWARDILHVLPRPQKPAFNTPHLVITAFFVPAKRPYIFLQENPVNTADGHLLKSELLQSFTIQLPRLKGHSNHAHLSIVNIVCTD